MATAVCQVLDYQKTTRMEGDKESTTELVLGFGLFQTAFSTVHSDHSGPGAE
jgi:hypothetical protein